MKEIETADDLKAALAAERAVIFFWVDWASQARESEALVQSALDVLQPARKIEAFKIDVSDQSGEAWDGVRKWLAHNGQDCDGITYGGYGSLLFVLRGRPIRAVVYPASRLPDGITRHDLAEAIDDFSHISADS